MVRCGAGAGAGAGSEGPLTWACAASAARPQTKRICMRRPALLIFAFTVPPFRSGTSRAVEAAQVRTACVAFYHQAAATQRFSSPSRPVLPSTRERIGPTSFHGVSATRDESPRNHPCALCFDAASGQAAHHACRQAHDSARLGASSRGEICVQRRRRHGRRARPSSS